MADPFKKVLVGQRVRQSAAMYNATVDAVRQVRERTQTGSVPSETNRDTGIVKVQNNSGGDLGRFAVVGLYGPLIDPANSDIAEVSFQSQPMFSVVEPESAHSGLWGILLEPLLDEAIGRCVVSGVTVAKVLATADTEDFENAERESGNSERLILAANGSAQVLWREPGTGIKWALIRISTPKPRTDVVDDLDGLYLYRTDCVNGVVYRYRRALSVADGAIAIGAWAFDSFQGCCDCSGSNYPPNSGSGRGYVIADPCPSVPIPETLCIRAHGGLYNCECAVAVSTAAWNGSRWVGNLTLPCAGSPTLHVELWFTGGIPAQWHMEVTGCGSSGLHSFDAEEIDCTTMGGATVSINPPNDCCGVNPEDGFFISFEYCDSDDGDGDVSLPCCEDGLPATLYATIANVSSCACIAGTYPLVWDGSNYWTYSSSSGVCSGTSLTISMSCSGSGWIIDLVLTDAAPNPDVTLSWQGTNASTCSLPLDFGDLIEGPSIPGDIGTCATGSTISVTVSS